MCQHLAGVISHVRLLLIGMSTAVTLILYWLGMTLPGHALKIELLLVKVTDCNTVIHVTRVACHHDIMSS